MRGFPSLCVVDANVLIDLHAGGLLREVFALPGLDDEGYVQLWLEKNPGDTVIMRDGTRRTVG
jgi:hypothetical protein